MAGDYTLVHMSTGARAGGATQEAARVHEFLLSHDDRW